ncbi:MAG: phosphomannose isomerase type II C-terminal cupin domain [Cyanobium sp.]
MTTPIPGPSTSGLPSGGAMGRGGAPAVAVGALPPQAGPIQEPERVHRPWGWYETLVIDTEAAERGRAGYGVKRLWIQAAQRISLQCHRQRSEHWIVVAGSGLLECGAVRIEATPGITLEVPVGAIHRATAGSDGLLIIEVQRGVVLQEDDIERFADDYGRVIVSQDNL